MNSCIYVAIKKRRKKKRKEERFFLKTGFINIEVLANLTAFYGVTFWSNVFFNVNFSEGLN